MPRSAKCEHENHVRHHNPMSGAPAHYYQSPFFQSPFFQNGSPSSASTSSQRSPQTPLSPPSSQPSSTYSHHQKSSLSQSSTQSSPQQAQSHVQNHSSQPAQHRISPLPSILSLTSVSLTGASALPTVQLSGPATPKTSRVIVDENGNKKHECGECPCTFKSSGHLKRHMHKHTRERNYKCPFPGCETTCTRNDNLKQHYRVHLSLGSRRRRGKDIKRASTASSSISSASSSAGTPSANSISAGASGSDMHTLASPIGAGNSGQEAPRHTKSMSPLARIDTPPPPLEEARLITGADGALYYPGTGQRMVTPPDTPPALTHATLPATASLASLNLPRIMGMQPHLPSQGKGARATASLTTKTSQPQTQVASRTSSATASSPPATSQAASVASRSSQHQSQYMQQQVQAAASVSSAHSSPKAQYYGSASNDTLPLIARALNYRYIGHGSLCNSVAQPTYTHMPSQQHWPQMQREPATSSIAAYSHSHFHQQPPHSYSQHSSPDPSRIVASSSVSQFGSTHQEVPSYFAGMPRAGLEAIRGPSPLQQPLQHQPQQQFTLRHSTSYISHPQPHTQVSHIQSTPSLMAMSSGGGSISSISSASSSIGSANIIPSGIVGLASPAILPSRRTPPTQSYSTFRSMQQQQHYPSQPQPQQQLPLPMHPLYGSVYTSYLRYTPLPLADTSAPTRLSSPAPVLAPLSHSGDGIAAVMAQEKYMSASAGSSMSWDVGSETRHWQAAARYAQELRYGWRQQHYQHQHVEQQQQAAPQQYQQQQFQPQQQQVQQQQQHQAQQQQYSLRSQYQAQHAQQHHVQHPAHVQEQQHDAHYVQEYLSAEYVSYHCLNHSAWTPGNLSGLKRSVGD